jgi:23S rRNA (uracil1939-C5)-methyltransferase
VTKQCIVDIQKYSKKGIGQGSALGLEKQVEVRGSHLNEKLLVEIFRKKKGVHEARVLEFLTPSPFRVSPRCSHAGVCGGCSWQELSYEHQVNAKETQVKALFSPYQEVTYLPMITMEDPWQFRNKMEFTFSEDKEGNRFLGLIMGGTKGKVITLSECHLTRPWMIEVLQAVNAWWNDTELKAYHRIKNTGTLENLTLREGFNTGEKLVMLSIAGSPSGAFSHRALEAFKTAVLKKTEGVVSIFLQIKHAQAGHRTHFSEMHLHGPDHIHEKLCITYPSGDKRVFTFKISPTSFFQPNTHQAEKLMSQALNIITPKKDLKVLDLYCGTATLGTVFSLLAKEVVGIELNPYAVFDAEANQQLNAISNLQVKQGDVAEILKTLDSSLKWDLVIVDPPRAGLGKAAIAQIVAIAAEEVLYISCNPLTQKEDVEELVGHGYQLKVVQPVDQFAHSYHLENIVLLQRKKSTLALT